jgi:hypothetical protein
MDVGPMRVRRTLASASLDCGCLAGIYETRSGAIVTLIDARSDRCVDRAHHVDAHVVHHLVKNPGDRGRNDAAPGL